IPAHAVGSPKSRSRSGLATARHSVGASSDEESRCDGGRTCLSHLAQEVQSLIVSVCGPRNTGFERQMADKPDKPPVPPGSASCEPSELIEQLAVLFLL